MKKAIVKFLLNGALILEATAFLTGITLAIFNIL